jgi:hypothetical protein
MNSLNARDLPDFELMAELRRLACSEREVTVRLIVHRAELDTRQLHLGVDRALDALLEQLARTKFAAARRPRASDATGGSRHIPAAVKRTGCKAHNNYESELYYLPVRADAGSRLDTHDAASPSFRNELAP